MPQAGVAPADTHAAAFENRKVGQTRSQERPRGRTLELLPADLGQELADAKVTKLLRIVLDVIVGPAVAPVVAEVQLQAAGRLPVGIQLLARPAVRVVEQRRAGDRVHAAIGKIVEVVLVETADAKHVAGDGLVLGRYPEQRRLRGSGGKGPRRQTRNNENGSIHRTAPP